jgi:murein DD-endopeptidase MepM/ murein hydrolase activator NlpD
VIWFLPQYPNAYAGPILSVNGSGNYLVGQGDRNTQAGPHLFTRFHDTSETYLPAAFPAGQWYHLAIVRSANEFRFFLNGLILGPVLTITNTTDAPLGTLRLGRSDPRLRAVDNHEAQFYGMMDELAVYTHALTNAEIFAQFANQSHLTGNELGLLAGWVFSPTQRAGLPPRMMRATVRSGQTALVANSVNWSGLDKQLIPLPEHQTMELPFRVGDAWKITQGFAADFSHRGYAAFCWDFQKADSLNRWTDVYPSGSFNAPIYSTDDGTVTYVYDGSPLPGATETGPDNMVWVRCVDGFTRQYLHLLRGSILVSVGQQISIGQQIARIAIEWLHIDRPGPHLHFGIVSEVDAPDVVTIPVAFNNYEVKNSDGSWSVVAKGIPLQDQIVRRRGWNDWRQLGSEPISSGPAVCSWAPGRLDVFARGTDNTLYTKSRVDNQWDNWHQLGANPIASDPAAVSWGLNRIDLFVRGTDNALYTKSWDGNQWSRYVGLGGRLTSGPAVCSWAAGRLDVFIRGTDNALWHRSYDGGWGAWEQLGANPIASDPAAVAWGPNRIDLFVRGTDNALYTKSWNNS